MRWVALSTAVLALVCLGAAGQPQGKTEQGFVALFDGKDLSHWHVMGGDVWKIENGELVCTRGGAGWLRSDRIYDDFVLRLEFKLEKGANSGVYIHAPLYGRQSAVGNEVQIMDSYGKKPTTGTCGALYGIMAPAVEASKPAGQWNELEITCRWPLIKTVLNGKVLYEVNMEDEKFNAQVEYGRKPRQRMRRGWIGLQSHTRSVRFRNIYIKAPTEAEQGFEPLFNGRDLSGWKPVAGGPKPKVVGGTIELPAKAGIVLDGELEDFELRADFKLQKDASGAALFRMAKKQRPIEIPLRDDHGKMLTWESTGALKGACPPSQDATLPAEQWNELCVVCRDRQLEVYVNAMPVVNTSLYRYGAYRRAPYRGAVSFVCRSGAITLRNIRVRKLR